MSLLDVGSRCQECTLVDFLPFTCPSCSFVFCRAHVQSHACPAAQSAQPGEPSRKRVKGTCAFASCQEETLESVGGFETSEEESIARQVRCVCGGAFCISHRSQEAHECTAPRKVDARHDAVLERREKAQEILQQTMPSQAGKERLTMPKQVDRTRREPVATPAGSTSEALDMLNKRDAARTPASPPPAPPPAPPSTADEKLHKVHVMKIKSLAKPLDPKVARAECCAVEWGIGDASRLQAWSEETKYSPSSAASALSSRKPERIWGMPGGKLLDTLVSLSKLPQGRDRSLVRISLLPGATRDAVPIKLDQPAGDQIAAGDVLLLIG